MAEAGAAQALLEALLPPAFLRRVVGQPQRLPEHFIDESLRASVADQLLRWKLRSGRAAYVYCLVEHKRTRERFGLVQLLRYQALLYAQLAKHVRERQELPTVLTVVVFNGKSRWAGPRRFHELIKPPKELRRFALDFEAILLDLSRVSVERLTTHQTLRGGLLALKTASVGPERQLPMVRRALKLLAADRSTLSTFLSYLGEVVDEDVAPLMLEAAQGQESPSMRSMNQYIRELGRRQGERRGLKRGRAETLRSSVTLVLEARFKRVTAQARARIDSADPETLTKWLSAAACAPTLESVFTA